MTEMAKNLANKNASADENLILQARNLERDTSSNMALVFLKEKNYKKAIEKATYSLNVEKTSKAYFRRGQANILKGDFEQAYKDFADAKEQDPESESLIEAEIKKAKKAEKEYDKKNAEKFSKAFSGAN